MTKRLLAAAGFLLMTGAATAQTNADPKRQTVAPAGSVPAKPGPAASFTGKVSVRALADPIAPGRSAFGEVTFPPGARSNWHTHPAGQTIYVLKGCGLTEQEGGPIVRICAGDTVYTPPGVKHWHGASADSAMTQLSATETVDGRNVDWMEPVSDAQYKSGPQARR